MKISTEINNEWFADQLDNFMLPVTQLHCVNDTVWFVFSDYLNGLPFGSSLVLSDDLVKHAVSRVEFKRYTLNLIEADQSITDVEAAIKKALRILRSPDDVLAISKLWVRAVTSGVTRVGIVRESNNGKK